MNASGAIVDVFCFHVIRCITIQLPVVDVLRYRGNSAGFRLWACALPRLCCSCVAFHLISKVGCYSWYQSPALDLWCCPLLNSYANNLKLDTLVHSRMGFG